MIGQTISHYRIVEKLGEGGMGVVWKARDTQLDRFVALKSLPPERINDEARRARFLQEARAASALNHPNIVTIYDVLHQEGAVYLVMEFVDGRALDQLIPRKGMRLGDALQTAIQITDALAAAHKAGIVHRDLKPGNVMVTREGRAKVLDFGLAKLLDPAPIAADDSTRTQRQPTEYGTILGTVSYMSPEQAEGRSIDTRSDIFSFGSVLYEMVTGRRAFGRNSNLSTISAILKEEPKPIPDAPHDLEKILARCLRKNPERRAQHMADIKIALEELKEESESGLPDKLEPAKKARLRWAWLAAPLVAALALAGFWWRSNLDREPVAAPSLKSVPLTTYTGSETAPSISPDGNQVAFVWNGEERDNFDIYVKLVSGGPPLRLTTNPAGDHSPAWSPDGSQIAFVRHSSGSLFTSTAYTSTAAAIFLISPLGGPERKLAEVSFGGRGPAWAPAWAPDGKSIAIAASESPDQSRGIEQIVLATGAKKRLTSPPSGYFGDLAFAFSPDGNSLAFARRENTETGDLFLLPLQSGSPAGVKARQLTFENRAIESIAWGVSGQIYFSSVGSTGIGVGGALWRLLLPTPGKPQRIDGIEGSPRTISLSRSGRLVYDRAIFDTNLWRAETRGPWKPTQIVASTRLDSAPDLSTDGTRLAFSSDRSGDSEIWASNADGSQPVQLTHLKQGSATPRWSPDGTRITFSSLQGPNRDVYTMDAGGGSLRRVTTEPSQEGRPCFSRDGRTIYFYSFRTGRSEIWKTSVDGGPATQVTFDGGHEFRESTISDGFHFTRGPGPVAAGLFFRSPAGADSLLLGEARYGYWSATDRGIYFTAGQKIRLYDSKTRKTSDVGSIERPTLRGAVGLTASRDGRWIVWSQIDQSDSDLLYVDDFR